MNRIYLPIVVSPWKGLRQFISKNRDVFTNDTRTSFKIGFESEKYGLKDVFDMDFRRFSGCDEVFVLGESGKHNMKTSIKLDPIAEQGTISLPEFGGSIKLSGNKFHIEENGKSDPLLPYFAEIYIKVYWRVIDHIVRGDDKPIEESLEKIRLKKEKFKYQ